MDPPLHSAAMLHTSGVPSRLIDTVILTHCHADHDSGTFQKVSPMIKKEKEAKKEGKKARRKERRKERKEGRKEVRKEWRKEKKKE